MPAIVAQQLTKTYGKEQTKAVSDVSFEVEKGEIFGLIGPDGAGKTSIFRMLTTLLLPNGGSATVNDLDVIKDYREIRRSVGYMPGKFSLYPDLSVRENLQFFATVFGTTIEANYHLIKDIYVQLEPFQRRRAGKLSGGMKQKLALCCALVHEPSVLFLDEPTTGVDPVSRKEFWEMLARLKESSITILVSTPYMDEAERCDRIGLIQTGSLLSIDTPAKIKSDYPDDLFAVKGESVPEILQAARKYEPAKDAYAMGEYVHISFEKGSTNETKITEHFKANQVAAQEVKRADPNIEDCFIYLLKK